MIVRKFERNDPLGNTAFGKLPIKKLVRAAVFPDRFFVGKAGIKLVNWQGNNQYLCGFSCSRQPAIAENVAVFELCERLTAKYEFQSFLGTNMNTFRAFTWPDGNPARVTKSQLFLGPNPFSQFGQEATGLGFGPDYHQALNHAILELLERHICAGLWYEAKYRLCKAIDRVSLDSFDIFYYTLHRPKIPFVLAIIYSNELEVLSVGHAIRSTFEEAKEKSYSEAVMLLDCVLHKDNGICTNLRTKNRLLSQRGPLAKERFQQFNDLTVNVAAAKNILSRYFSISEITAAVLGTNDDIEIIQLFRDRNFWSLRALSKKVATLAERRQSNRYSEKQKILDPYC